MSLTLIHIDNVLQSTMMWLFVTIACLMRVAGKSDASPKVTMDVVSSDFSPFFSCLGMQAPCAAVVWAGHMVLCVYLHQGLVPDSFAGVLQGLQQTFIPEFGPSQPTGSMQLFQAWSFTVVAPLTCHKR